MKELYWKIRHLIWLYFDLREHKKQKRIRDYKIRWNSYFVMTIKCPQTIEYKLEK